MVFRHLLEIVVINWVKKVVDNARKTGIDAAKTALKRVVPKTAEATGDLIGKKIAEKITSLEKNNE